MQIKKSATYMLGMWSKHTSKRNILLSVVLSEKLSYGAKGPFIITTDLGQGSYEVQRYDDPT